jgi:prepilin peptidase CpaA
VASSIEFALIALVSGAAWSDFRTRHIPNWITVSGALTGLALQTLSAGLHGTLTSVAGTVLGVGVFLGLFIAGGLGAGDVKLFGAVGALVGPGALVFVFVFTGLLGGVAAILLAVYRGRLRETLDSTSRLLRGSPLPPGRVSLRLPYGVIIAGGVFLWLMYASV